MTVNAIFLAVSFTVVSVLLYFNNIFCWLKFGLIFTRPAVFYLGPGPRDHKHVKKVLAMFVL